MERNESNPEYSEAVEYLHDDFVDGTFFEVDLSAIPKRRKLNTSGKPSKSKNILHEEEKIKMAKEIRNFTCLWDKKDKFFRNNQKRDAAWIEIANKQNMTSNEAKSLWKKVKDTYRYIQNKGKKAQAKIGDAATDDYDDLFDDDGNQLRDELSFLDENASSSLRQTISLDGESSNSRPSTSMSDFENRCNTPTTTSNYSYMTSRKNKSSDDTGMKAAQLIGTSISNYLEKKQEEKPQMDNLKHFHIWLQLEKLFEQLDVSTITDLNFSFVASTYNSIKTKRNNNLN